MQEMKLIDAVALKDRWLHSDHKGVFVNFIDNAPEIPAVPLEVHEKMKRELNTEIEAWREKALSEGKTTATEIRAEMYQHRVNAERIARLMEENKNLTEKLNATIAGQETLQKALAEKNAEVKDLEHEYAGFRAGVGQGLKMAQAEAIKEFAEKTNKMITDIYNKHIFGCNDLNDEEKDAIINFSDDITGGFDNLVKEMVGDVE